MGNTGRDFFSAGSLVFLFFKFSYSYYDIVVFTFFQVSCGMFNYRADAHIAISMLSQHLSCTFRDEKLKKKNKNV